MHRTTQGASTVEYVLVGIIVISCFAALTMLGDKLIALFDQQVVASMFNAPIKRAYTPSSVSISGSPHTFSASVVLSTQAITSQLNSAWQPATGGAQVAGANGVTQVLATTFSSYVQGLLDTGKVSKEQANLLFRLANDGHQLANAQSAFEQALQTGQQSIVYDGKTYSTKELGGLLGFTKDTTQAENWELNPEIASVVLRPFALTYQDVQKDALFNDSDVRQQVTLFSSQIGALADALSWSAEEIRYSNLRGHVSPYENYIGNLKEHFASNMATSEAFVAESIPASAATTIVRTNSEKICGVGFGTNSDNTCN